MPGKKCCLEYLTKPKQKLKQILDNRYQILVTCYSDNIFKLRASNY